MENYRPVVNMKDNMMFSKNSFPLLIGLSAFFWVACNNQVPQEEEKDDEPTEYTELPIDSAQLDDQEDLYMCPMDCENGKLYHEPGNCKVCKMPYEKALK